MKYLDLFARLDDSLRDAGMACGVDVWLRVYQLIERLEQRNAWPSDRRQWLPLLRPLFCRNPEEQARFAFLFEQCLSEKPKNLSSVNQISSPQQWAIDESLAKAAKVKRQWLWGGALLLMVMVAALVLLWPKPQKVDTIEKTDKPPVIKPTESGGSVAKPPVVAPPSEPPQSALIINLTVPQSLPEPEPDTPEELPGYLKVLLFSLPWIAAAIWLAATYRQKFSLLRDKNSGDDRINKITFEQQFTPIWGGADAEKSLRELRAARLIPTRRLDIDATIEVTARNGDYFQPVYRTRRIAPEHVLLVRSVNRNDQQAQLAEELAIRFKNLGLEVKVYRFRDDPRWLARWNDQRGNSDYFQLEQIIARHGNARLLIISETDILFHPYSGEPRAWLAALSPWQDKAWLYPYDARKPHAKLLVDHDFVVLPMSRDSLPELISRLTAVEPSKLTVPELRTIELPDIIAMEPDGWLGEDPPCGVDLADLEWELEHFLGTYGLRLLRAIAVYPKPQWKLTMALDYLLYGKLGKADPPARREQRLSRLSRLPWLMHGFMPNWLREHLLINSGADERERVVTVWQSLFSQLNDDNRKSLQLDFSTPSKRQIKLQWNRLRAMPQSDAINDPIFAHILMGGQFGWFDFYLPQALAKRLPYAQRALDLRPVLGAAAGALFGMAVISGIIQMNTEPPFEPEQWTVTLHHQDTAKPLAIALQQHLQQDQFQVAQSGEIGDAANKPVINTILYPPGGEKAAARIKHRLAWLAYGSEVDTALDKSLKPDDKRIKVQLVNLYGAAFSDALRFESPNKLTPTKVQVEDSKFIVVPKPLKKPDIKIQSENSDELLKKLIDTLVNPVRFLSPGFDYRSLSFDGKTVAVIEPEMVRIEPGKFMMGSPKTEVGRDSDEDPQHEVTINYIFEISKYEVTFDEYDAFVKDTPGRKSPNDSGWGRGKRPVINVSFNDAQAYVQWLSKKTGKKYRLPTEAEWEYAARAGTQTRYWWGDDIGNNNANCDGCGSQWDNKQTAPVGSFKANTFDLHDTAGNVWEWAQDCWHENYDNAPKDGSAWLEKDGGDCSRRVVRGGSWIFDPQILRSADRGRGGTVSADSDLGFRIARAL